MPHGDGTGPLGLGPGTGWGAGYCAGYSYPGYFRSRFYMGRGAGHRNRYWFDRSPGWPMARWYGFNPYPGPDAGPMSEEEELTFLRREAEDLERALGDVRTTIQEMEKKRK